MQTQHTQTVSNGQPVSFGDLLAARKRSDVDAATGTAIEFLRSFDGIGRHHLTAISEAGLESKAFEAQQWAEMAAWVGARNGRANLYFSPNEPIAGAPDRKLRKDMIGAIRAVCVDVDPAGEPKDYEQERRRLLTLADGLAADPAPPTFVLDSGNGVQAFWLLDKKLPATEIDLAEGMGRTVAAELGGDHTHNIDRIMRLPGTVNVPDARKAAMGRTPRLARLLHCGDRRYSREQLATRFPPAEAPAASDKSVDISLMMRQVDLHFVSQAADYGEVDVVLRGRFEDARRRDPELDELWRHGTHRDKDRSASGRRFALAKLMKSWRFTINEYGQLLHVWEHAVKPTEDPFERLDAREIARAWVNSAMDVKPEAWFDNLDDLDDLGDDERTSTGLLPSPTPATQFEIIPFRTAASMGRNLESRPLIDGLLEQGALSILYGPSNVGKSFVGIGLGFAVSAGIPVAGLPTTHCGVVYIAAEGGRAIMRRMTALEEHAGPAITSKAHFGVLPRPIDLRTAGADVRGLIQAVKQMEKTMQISSGTSVGMIIVDTFSRVFAGGDENSSAEMGKFVGNLDRLRQETGAHLLVIHHSGKDQTKGARGHSILRAAADTEIEVAENQWHVTKQRDMDRSLSRKFVLDQIQIGVDAKGKTQSSCVVRYVDSGDLPTGVATPAEERVLAAMKAFVAAVPGRTTMSFADILSRATLADGAASAASVRKQLASLLEKRLVRKPGRGVWALQLEFPKLSEGDAGQFDLEESGIELESHLFD